MTPLSNEQFLSLRQHAELIEADHCGEKVLKLSDGSFFKLFRRKRLISSEMYRPYAKRFALNAEKLTKLQIPCPTIISTYTIASIQRTAVHYWPLPGATLRQEFHDITDEKHASLCCSLGAFIAKLHDSGVYFRSLHLGNVVITPDGSLGLIDIADMQVVGSSISNQKRKRNFLHLFRYSKDIEHLWRHREEFVNAYCEKLSARKNQNFSSYLNGLFTKAKRDRVEEQTP